MTEYVEIILGWWTVVRSWRVTLITDYPLITEAELHMAMKVVLCDWGADA